MSMLLAMSDTKTTWAPVWAAVIAVLMILGVSSVKFGLWSTLTAENGGAEVVSSLLWLYVAWIYLRMSPGPRSLKLALTGVFLIFFLRELDFHDWWFEPGLLHIGLFSGPAALWQKVVGAWVMLVIVACVGTVLVLGLPPFLRALYRRAPWAFVVTLGVVVVAMATQLDGLDRKLAPYDLSLSSQLLNASLLAEEMGELAFPFSALIAIVLYRARQRNFGSEEA